MAKPSKPDQFVLGDPVLVEWRDACSHGRWRDVESYRRDAKTARCQSVGFVVHENKDEIQLAQTRSTDAVLDTICIPRGWVTRKVRIRG